MSHSVIWGFFHIGEMKKYIPQSQFLSETLGSLKKYLARLCPQTVAAEVPMQALDYLEEEDRMDDDAIEIASDDEFTV